MRLALLQARRDWPGALLAERLDVSPRTVRRDVDRLRELGYPIEATKGPDGGYRLGAGSELPPLLLDDDQAVALAVALQLATASGAGIEEAALRALGTVRQVMPARLRRRIDTLTVTALPPSSGGRGPVDAGVLTALTAAIHASESLRLDHDAGDGSTGPRAPRRVEPHHVVSRGDRWYLVAWDLDRVDWRTFRVDRITLRSPNGPRFVPREVPGGDVAAFVDGRFRGQAGGAGTSWPCVGEVVLHLPAAEVAAHTPDGVVEAIGESHCRLVQGSWSWVALAAALGRFDADIEVVGPDELRDAFAALASRYASAAAASLRHHVAREALACFGRRDPPRLAVRLHG